MKIAIIGAGIGGLTVALTLKQKGFQVDMYEAASEIKPVGAGIIMANNAMQLFDKLGVREKIEKAGSKISTIQIVDEQFNVLSEGKLDKFEKQYGVYNVAIHRADLHAILAHEIGEEQVHLGKRLVAIKKEKEYELHMEDGEVVCCDVLIGADGIKSVVRGQLFGKSELRDSGQVCWRGVCEIDLSQEEEFNALEAWGKGRRFGFVQISDRKIYWYAVASEHLVEDENAIYTLFNTFYPTATICINSTLKEEIIYGKIADLKELPKWQKDKVCLLGDAAHATTPNMGQGACQAVEDAYVLGELLEKSNSVEEAFQQYEKLRRNKVQFIVNTSWKIGKMTHYENPMAIWLRNMVVKNIPASVNENQLKKVFDVSYPF